MGISVFGMLISVGCADQDAPRNKLDLAQSATHSNQAGEQPRLRAVSAETAPLDIKAGRSVFNNKCLSCHGEGIKGAPKLGDAAAWTDRVEQDLDVLIHHAINGHGGMPPKGGFSELKNAQVASAVAYVVSKSQRLIRVAEKRKQATGCHPINNPALCTEEELRDALTLQMMWMLRGATHGS